MKLDCSTGNAIVDQMTKIEIKGNIIPQAWTKTICYENGKPNWNAIMILSDVVYWYKPTEIRDETEGFKGYKKRFKSDLLQRSYEQIMEMYKMTESQAKRGVKFLEKLGVLKRHFRDVSTQGGLKAHNVMYLELVPIRLYELTYPSEHESMGMGTLKSTYGNFEDDTMSILKLPYDNFQVDTNTEITTKNNNTSINPSRAQMDKIKSYTQIIKQNIRYECLIQKFDSRENGILNDLVSVMIEIVAIDRDVVRVEKIDYPYQFVKSQFLKLREEHIEWVVSSLMKNNNKKTKPKGYLITTLFNASNTLDTYLQAEANYNS